MHTKRHNKAVKRRLLKVHPEWKGRIWFFEETVTVRGIGNVWGTRCDVDDYACPEKEARWLLEAFSDLVAKKRIITIEKQCEQIAALGVR